MARKRSRRQRGLGWNAQQHKVRQQTMAYGMGVNIKAAKAALHKGNCDTAFEKFEQALEYSGAMFEDEKARVPLVMIRRAGEGEVRLSLATATHMGRLRKAIIACYKSHCRK